MPLISSTRVGVRSAGARSTVPSMSVEKNTAVTAAVSSRCAASAVTCSASRCTEPSLKYPRIDPDRSTTRYTAARAPVSPCFEPRPAALYASARCGAAALTAARERAGTASAPTAGAASARTSSA
ncbi:hypothetical protein STANM309S_00521 [Streptomyces tanashiensis]